MVFVVVLPLLCGVGRALSRNYGSMFRSEALWCYYFGFFVSLGGISKARELWSVETCIEVIGFDTKLRPTID